jgi:hypothetical protein
LNLAYCGRNALAGLGLLLVGCVEQPGAERIIGPDGTLMLHVHCADEQVACFQLAGERCPRGYDLSPVFDPHDGNFLVRCREPASVTAANTNPPQSQPVAASQPMGATATATNASWPPAEVAMPTEPWPSAPSNGLPPTQPSASGRADFGY